MRGYPLLPLPLPLSMLELTWLLSSSLPLRVVAIGIVSGGVNDMSGCLPAVAMTTAAAATATMVTGGAVIVAGGGGGRCGWRLALSVVV